MFTREALASSYELVKNVSVRSRSNWNLQVLVFEKRGKLEYPEKNLWEQRREPTTNLTNIWLGRWYLKPGHIGRR